MAKKSFKIGKLNIKSALTRSAVIAATGAAAQVVATLIEGDDETNKDGKLVPKNQDIADYAMIGAGILLPEVMKGNQMIVNAADALLAVGAYRLADHMGLAEKMGINGLGSSNDVKMIGTQYWNPKHTNKVSNVNRVSKVGKSDVAVQ